MRRSVRNLYGGGRTCPPDIGPLSCAERPTSVRVAIDHSFATKISPHYILPAGRNVNPPGATSGISSRSGPRHRRGSFATLVGSPCTEPFRAGVWRSMPRSRASRFAGVEESRSRRVVSSRHIYTSAKASTERAGGRGRLERSGGVGGRVRRGRTGRNRSATRNLSARQTNP